MPLSGEDGKGNLSWHVFFSGEATYARTEGKHHPVRKVLKHLFSHSHQKVEMMQRVLSGLFGLPVLPRKPAKQQWECFVGMGTKMPHLRSDVAHPQPIHECQDSPI